MENITCVTPSWIEMVEYSRQTTSLIKKSGFKILNNKENQAIIYLTLKRTILPKEMVKSGPPLKLTNSVKAFKKKYKNTFEEKDKIKAKVTTKDRNIKTSLSKILEHKYIQEKIKKRYQNSQARYRTC